MRRIITVLTAAALMAAWLVVLQVPAMAQTFRFDNDDNDHGSIFDRDNDDNGFIFDRDNDDNDGFFFNNNDRFNRGFDIDQDIGPTGDVDLNSEIVNTGNNSNQCAAPLQFGNTGNLQNAQGFSSFGSSSDNGFDNGFFGNRFFGFDGNIGDVDFEAPSFEFLPEQAVECGQGVFQSAAANG